MTLLSPHSRRLDPTINREVESEYKQCDYDGGYYHESVMLYDKEKDVWIKEENLNRYAGYLFKDEDQSENYINLIKQENDKG
jgi:hypothetical protein